MTGMRVMKTKRNHKWVKLKSDKDDEAGRRGVRWHKVTFILDLFWVKNIAIYLYRVCNCESVEGNLSFISSSFLLECYKSIRMI